jgi:site-specific recombinase XerD
LVGTWWVGVFPLTACNLSKTATSWWKTGEKAGGRGLDIAVTILEYKRQMQVKGYAKNTITLYSWGLDCFRDYLEAHHINDIRKISPQTIEAYQAKVMAQPIAMETKALKLRAVKRLFESLEQDQPAKENAGGGADH